MIGCKMSMTICQLSSCDPERWCLGWGRACEARGGEGCWLVVVASNSALSWQVEQLKEELAQGEELKKRAAELQQEVSAVRRPENRLSSASLTRESTSPALDTRRKAHWSNLLNSLVKGPYQNIRFRDSNQWPIWFANAVSVGGGTWSHRVSVLYLPLIRKAESPGTVPEGLTPLESPQCFSPSPLSQLFPLSLLFVALFGVELRALMPTSLESLLFSSHLCLVRVHVFLH